MHPTTKYIMFKASRDASMMFTSVTYSPFLKSIGLSMSELAIINGVFMAVMILAQVPTGVFADRYGRGLSLKIGVAILTVGQAGYIFACGFWSALLLEALVGLGIAFGCGADEAWVASTLARLGETKRQGSVFANIQIVQALTGIASGALGGVLGTYGLRWPWVAATVLAAASTTASFVWLHDRLQTKQDPSKSYVKDSIALFRNSWALQWGVALRCATALVIPFFYFFPLVFGERNELRGGLSSVWILLYGAATVGSIVIRILGKRTGNGVGIGILAASPIVVGMTLMVLGKTGSFDGLLVSAMSLQAMLGMANALYPAFVQRRILESCRATYGSLQSLIIGAWETILLFVVYAILATRPDTTASVLSLWWQLGVLMIAGGTVLAIFRPRAVTPHPDENAP